jgi:hypothetical protein
VLELGAGIQRHPFEHDLVDAAVARRGDRDAPGLRLRSGNHVRDGVVGRADMRREHERRVAHHRDGRKVALDVVGHLFEHGRIDRHVPAGCHDHGVAVGRGLRRRRHGDETIAAGPVLHQHLLAPGFRQLGAEDARGNVGDAARGIGHQDVDGLGRVILGLRGRRAKNDERDDTCDPSHEHLLRRRVASITCMRDRPRGKPRRRRSLQAA